MLHMGAGGEYVILALGLLPGLLAAAIVIALLVTVSRQNRRIAHLEERVRHLERGAKGA